MNLRNASFGALGCLLIAGWLSACQDKSPRKTDAAPAALAPDQARPALTPSKGETPVYAEEEEEAPPPDDPYAPSSMPIVEASAPANAPVDLTLEKVKTGIAECDAFVHAMNGCYLPKVAPEQRDEILAAMKQERFAWQQASATESDATRTKCVESMRARASILARAGCLP